RLGPDNLPCGGRLIGNTRNHVSGTKGRKREKCVICGRATFKAMHPPKPFTRRFRLASDPVYPAGSPVCSYHETIPAEKPTGWPEVYDVPEAEREAMVAEWLRWRESCRVQDHGKVV